MYKFIRYGLLTASLLLLVGIMSGCGSMGNRNEILIGTNLELSGPGAVFAESTEMGIELAKDEINDQGGLLGKPVRLVSVDNHSDAADAGTAMKQLTTRRVRAVIGPNFTECVQAVIKSAEASRLPVISPAGSYPGLTVDPASREVYKYVFRATFIDPYQGRAMAGFAVKELKAHTAVIICDMGQNYSAGLGEFFKKEFEAAGGTVLDVIPVDEQDGDWESLLSELRLKEPAVIYVPLHKPQADSIIRRVRSAGITVPILGPDCWGGAVVADDVGSLMPLYFTGHYVFHESNPRSAHFMQAYYEKYGKEADEYAALGYDSMMMVADAVKRGNSDDSESIAEALGRTMDFPGVTGPIDLDANHDAVKDVFILTFKDSKPVFVEKIPIEVIQGRQF